VKASFDQPSFTGIEEGDVLFIGWCFHPEGEVTALTLTLDGASYPARFALERLDVGRAFPDAPTAARSGFLVSVPLKPGKYRVSLEAEVTGIGRSRFVAGERLVVKRPPWSRRIVARFPALGLPAFLAAKTRTRLASGRGWPSWTDLPTLLRDATTDHRRHARTTQAVRHGAGFTVPARMDPYDAWLAVNVWTPRREAKLRARLEAARALPLISVVTPVFRPDLRYFAETAESVRGQVYENWEWCLADDASGDRELSALLERLAAADGRIRYTAREANGHISRATNSAAELARGEFLAFLDHDDLLSPDALAEVALHLAAHPDVDVLYTDDDKVDVRGRRYAPQFKPDWSPEALLSSMYLSHLLVIRRTVFGEIGGLRPGFEGSQDHDLALRATERARRVGHLPFVTYHWRALPGSVAVTGEAKPYSFDSGLRAVEEALQRRGVAARVERPDWAVRAALGVIRHRFPDEGPSVAVLIATRNRVDLLRRCVTSLAATTYKNYEVIILDDHSDDPATLAFFSSTSARVVRKPGPRHGFNFAALHNHAAREVRADYLLFLNNDTEVRAPEWLSQMVGFGQLEGVGAVGARLLYPDGTVQHAGVLHHLDRGSLGLPFRGVSERDAGYLGGAKTCRNYSAVTAACMLTPRRLFLEHGGFDEAAFPVSFNDVDYCYRLVDAGYRCVYAAEAELLHHEGASRGLGSRPDEIARLVQRYRRRAEPYYNQNLSPLSPTFEVQPRRLVRGRRNTVKAVMFSNALDLTGAPWCQLELTVALRARGVIDPEVVSLTDGALRAQYEERGIPVSIRAPAMEAIGSSREYDREVAMLGRELLDSGAQVVYGNTLRTFFAIDAARRVGLPTLWNIRESEPWATYYDDLPEATRRAALGCFAAPYRVIFVSHASRAVFEALNSRHNFCVIHDGLELAAWEARVHPWTRASGRRELALGESDVALLLLGTVCERKGQHDLVQALALVSSESARRLRCFVVGDRPGEYSRRLGQLVASLPDHFKERVHVVRETQEVAPFYTATDIFVCTSRVESYPRVTLEAMACGLPIISTPVFGLAEQLVEGANALFYQPGDVAALAAAVDRLTGNPILRTEMGQQSRLVLAGRQSFEAMVDEYETAFLEAAETA
jgi:GT2 family glycosyltransferase/glycosyltransferase involved in cell wall biosynthesis